MKFHQSSLACRLTVLTSVSSSIDHTNRESGYVDCESRNCDLVGYCIVNCISQALHVRYHRTQDKNIVASIGKKANTEAHKALTKSFPPLLPFCTISYRTALTQRSDECSLLLLPRLSQCVNSDKDALFPANSLQTKRSKQAKFSSRPTAKVHISLVQLPWGRIDIVNVFPGAVSRRSWDCSMQSRSLHAWIANRV